MWSFIAQRVLKNRLVFIIIVILITAFMGYKAQDVELDYHYAALLPKTDSTYIDYQTFQKKFGDDGNVMIVGVNDSNFFKVNKFNDWIKALDSVQNVNGIESVLSVSEIASLDKNAKLKKFEFKKIFPKEVKSQTELDSLKDIIHNYPFYEGFIFYKTNNLQLLAVTFEQGVVNNKKRDDVLEEVEGVLRNWGKKHNAEMRFSGLPYTRTRIAIMIKEELNMFIIAALLITAIILFLFFRSFKVVLFSCLIVGAAVVWSLGTIVLFQYKLTVLTGMIPPLLIVIGIPNSVFLLNKFHKEFKHHGNKIKALHRVISRVGNATFLTNLTTAAGFATFLVTGNKMLMEFGIVAALNIMGVFLLSITLIPVFFSFLSDPKHRHTKHLDYKFVGKVVDKLVFFAENKRKYVYLAVLGFIIAAGIGISLIKTQGFIIDDIPKDNPIYVDVKFFEKMTGGVMPLEIIVSKKDSLDYHTIRKINEFQERLKKYKCFSKPLSISDIAKFANQAYFKGKKKFYKFPDITQAKNIQPYLSSFSGNNNLASKFIDSTYHSARISVRVEDLGTNSMLKLRKDIENELAQIFNDKKYEVIVTGSSIVFTQGTKHLVNNLFTSLALAIFLISVLMATMFSSFRMILVSIVPNILPLVFTAAIMGYFGVPIKPSTVLVFSITFGISVDNAIHFLTKYRQELIASKWDIHHSVVSSLRETGVSIIYTATILFFGFGIFTISDFGGTQAIGTLVSITLLFAMLSNLVLLPSLLLSYKNRITTKAFKDYVIKPTVNSKKGENNKSLTAGN